MKLAYVDTSCLVAIALDEPDAERVRKRLLSFDRLVSSNLLEAEFMSALHREQAGYDGSVILSWISWIHPNRSLTPEFKRTLEVGSLRGADLWHLACALLIFQRPEEISFLTLDRRQEEAAKILGFKVPS